VWESIKGKFKQDEQGLWYNEFMAEVIEARAAKAKISQMNGKLGGRKVKPTQNKTELQTQELTQQVPRDEAIALSYSNSNSISQSNEDRDRGAGEGDGTGPGLDPVTELWDYVKQVWPRKEGMGGQTEYVTFQRFDRHLQGTTPEKFRQAIDIYLEFYRLDKTRNTHIPQIITFLNDERDSPAMVTAKVEEIRHLRSQRNAGVDVPETWPTKFDADLWKALNFQQRGEYAIHLRGLGYVPVYWSMQPSEVESWTPRLIHPGNGAVAKKDGKGLVISYIHD
jgi:hypothetical protein